MPTSTTRPAKKAAAKKTPRKGPPKKAAAKRALSAGHKKALAEGRSLSSVVDRYLLAVSQPKQRGRKVTTASVESQIAKLRTEARAPGVKGVIAIQKMHDLEVRLAKMLNAGNATNIKEAEAAFVKVAKQFGEKRGIGYAAWRTAGVPAAVLQKAGIARTRSA